MMKPKISIVMSVYNSEKYLSECIESLLNQTFKDFEFIIVNDKSTDGSLKIINSYKARDKRIISINNKENSGLTKSLNYGIKIAKGKYIARQDSDDISMPERLEKQYEYLEKNPDVYLLGTNCIFLYRGYKFTKWTVSDSKENRNTIPKYNYLIHSSIMFRNDGKAGYRDKFYTTQDYDLYLTILTKNLNINNLQEPLVYFRVNDEGISSNKRAVQKFFGKKAKEFYLERLKTGTDSYDAFQPDKELSLEMENPNFMKDNYATGIQFAIDLMIYASKLETFKLICKNIAKLPITYVLKKLVLLLIPLRFMRLQTEVRKSFGNYMKYDG